MVLSSSLRRCPQNGSRDRGDALGEQVAGLRPGGGERGGGGLRAVGEEEEGFGQIIFSLKMQKFSGEGPVFRLEDWPLMRP